MVVQSESVPTPAGKVAPKKHHAILTKRVSTMGPDRQKEQILLKVVWFLVVMEETEECLLFSWLSARVESCLEVLAGPYVTECCKQLIVFIK